MGILTWVIFGLIAGAIARFVVPGQDRSGCLGTLIIGIIGAVVGGFIGTQFGWGTVQEFNIRSLGIAVVGGVVVLVIRRMFTRR